MVIQQEQQKNYKMENKEFKGLIPSLMEQPTFSPEPAGTFTIEKFNEIIKLLAERDEERRKNGWKPEYVLTDQEAAELPFELIKYISETHRMLCSLKASEILEKRETEFHNH